jgi:hypothetical protein
MTALLLSALLAVNSSAGVRGQYVEGRTCDVFTDSCFANADTGLTGKNAVLAWEIDAGVTLDGTGVVVVLSAADTLGLKQSGPGRSAVLVDDRATTGQRDALAAFATSQAGEVVAVRSAAFDLEICHCDGEACATLKAGAVKVRTRRIDPAHDKECGNEDKATAESPAVQVKPKEHVVLSYRAPATAAGQKAALGFSLALIGATAAEQWLWPLRRRPCASYSRN